MQGVFDCVSFVDVNVQATGYASPRAILPRLLSPRSRLLMYPCLTLRQTTYHANLAPWGSSSDNN